MWGSCHVGGRDILASPRAHEEEIKTQTSQATGPCPEQTRTLYWHCHVARKIANPDLSQPSSIAGTRILKGGLINLRSMELVNEESGAALERHCCLTEPIVSILGSSLEKG
jgi:hypothetical protein